MSTVVRPKNERSTCCHASVIRGPRIAGYIPYCEKCRKQCGVEKIKFNQ